VAGGADLTLNIEPGTLNTATERRSVIEKYIQQADRINHEGSKRTKVRSKELFSLWGRGVAVVKAIDRYRSVGYMYFIFGY
jgi:hypothetical protein